MTTRIVSALFFTRTFGVAVGTFGFATLALACGLHPPLQNGAAVTQDGMQVALLRQSCSQTVEADQPGNDLVEATVEVQVHNGSATPVRSTATASGWAPATAARYEFPPGRPTNRCRSRPVRPRPFSFAS